MGNCVWDILYERKILSIKNGKNKEKEKKVKVFDEKMSLSE